MLDNNQRPKKVKKGEDGAGTEKSASSSERSAGGDKRRSADQLSHKPRVVLPSYMEPTYYIGGGNGNAIIEDVMNDMGWKPTKDKYDDSYRLKWCELKTAINYNTFKEGDQMVNHIPNCNLLTNKLGLLNSLQEYDRTNTNMKRRALKLDFIPETLRLDDAKDRETFLQLYKEGELWICKPTGRNQGKGIFIIRKMDDVKQALGEQPVVASSASQEETTGPPDDPTGGEPHAEQAKETKPKPEPKPAPKESASKRKSTVPTRLNRIVQRYICNPLLVEGKKFDIRCYMLVASTVPFLVLFHAGYIRVSLYEYDNDDANVTAHLTNQFIQKKDPKYKEMKEETTWSMERFNQYINEQVAPKKEDIEKDWTFGPLTSRMKQIMLYCFNAVKSKLACKIGYFDLYGFDFMIDEEMKVWLIEVNVNPCLATNCKALKDVVPHVVRETIHICVECFEKSRKGRPFMPLQSLKEFEVLFNGSPKGATSTRSQRSRSLSPKRRARSLSPVKENITLGAEGPNTRSRPNAYSPSRVPQSTRTSSFPTVSTIREAQQRTSVEKEGHRQSSTQKSGDSKRDESMKTAKGSRPPASGPATSDKSKTPKPDSIVKETKTSQDTADKSTGSTKKSPISSPTESRKEKQGKQKGEKNSARTSEQPTKPAGAKPTKTHADQEIVPRPIKSSGKPKKKKVPTATLR